MAWLFADSFDFYAAITDMGTHWDSIGTQMTLQPGRFAGSQGLRITTTAGVMLTRASGSNDATHHLVFSLNQTAVLAGTTLVWYLQLLDGTNGQCCVVFRSDGTILLTSGTPGGTVLATYSSAFASGVWNGYEIEITIHNTAGAIHIRKNGALVDDFSATGLNTRPVSANNYANKLQIGFQTNSAPFQILDDLLWFSTSGAAPNTWVGDIRSCQLTPSGDASIQFTPSSGANNYSRVNQAQQDGLTSYVYDSTVGHADFYDLTDLPFVPVSIIGLVTRGYVEKSDAGLRQMQLQLKSGAVTVQSTTLTLATSFVYTSRVDTVDPNTTAAWTAAAVNAVQVGPIVTT